MDETIEQAVSLDSRAVAAKESRDETEKLIGEFMPFISARAIKYSSRLEKDDHDEILSAAMLGFNEAIRNYDIEKGHFFPFANRVVCDRIIDCARRLGKAKFQTVPLDEKNDEHLSAQSDAISEISLRFYEAQRRQESISEEIEQFKTELMTWGITMDALVKHSPRHKKLRETYCTVVTKICQDYDVMQTIQLKHYFPIKAAAELTGLPQKTLERARIFILASVIIKLGDYDYLSEYVSGVR